MFFCLRFKEYSGLPSWFAVGLDHCFTELMLRGWPGQCSLTKILTTRAKEGYRSTIADLDSLCSQFDWRCNASKQATFHTSSTIVPKIQNVILLQHIYIHIYIHICICICVYIYEMQVAARRDCKQVKSLDFDKLGCHPSAMADLWLLVTRCHFAQSMYLQTLDAS